MADRLTSTDLALNYGINLQKLPGGKVTAKIVTTPNGTGGFTTAQFQISYDLDPNFLKNSKSPNDPPDNKEYQVNFNELGFPKDKDLFDPNSKNVPQHKITVNFEGGMPVLTASIPLMDPIKRDSEALIGIEEKTKNKVD